MHLGLSSEEFWQLTLRELEVLFKAAAERERARIHADRFMAAAIQASIYNAQRSKSTQRVFTPEDFMPLPQAKRLERPTNEQMLNNIRVLNALMGGTEG